MKLNIRVDTGSGPYEVSTNLFTLVAWERKYKTKASNLANGIGMEDLAFLAWEASKQSDVTVPAVFDDFVRRVQDLEVISHSDTVPTREDLSDENS